MPDEKGKTRREKNSILEIDSPPLFVSDQSKYLWEIYFDLSDSISRIYDGVCSLISPSDFKDYFELTGTIVYSHEYDILRKMDREYCSEMNKELEAYNQRRLEEQKRQL